MSLHCVTSTACGSYANWVSPGSDEVLTTDEDEKEKVSALNFTASWTDDGRNLICRPSGSNDDVCLDRSIQLTVECAYR